MHFGVLFNLTSLIVAILDFLIASNAKSVSVQTLASNETSEKETFNEEGIVFRRCIQNGTIAITFDDGPETNGNWTTERVLDVLKYYGVGATFFVVGSGYTHIDNETTREVLRRTVGEGHYIGSHTWNHRNLEKISKEHIFQQMNQLSFKLQEVLGEPPKTMRPPYGNYNKNVIDIINGQLGYKIILWSIDTRDWANRGNITKSMEPYKMTLEGSDPTLTPGHIVLHHDPSPGSAKFAATAIEYGKRKGYRFIGLKECIGLL